MAFTSTAIAQDLSGHFKIYSVKKQSIVSLSEIIADMAQQDVLFFGEDHNDSVAHFLEFEIFKNLSLKYPVALSMEMFTTDT